MDWEADSAESWNPAVYLIVKRGIGPLFNRSLFLFISDLNNHAGVNVFPNQLSGFCDVNGNLENKVRINSQLYPMSLLLYSCADTVRTDFKNHVCFSPESSVVSLQCLECKSSPWTWKSFIICVILKWWPISCTTCTVKVLHLLLVVMTLGVTADIPGWSSGVSSSSSGDSSDGAATALST